MENTAAEEMYDFTKNRREKINLELSKIRSLYGREDVVYRFNAYKKAKDKDDIARKKGRSGYSGLPSARIELESACKSVGIEKTPRGEEVRGIYHHQGRGQRIQQAYFCDHRSDV